MMLPIVQQLDYTRVQSPSSINTYRQCPRKYYYHYIEKLPTSPSIHLLRGSIAHTALEEFFLLPGGALTENYQYELRVVLKDLFRKHWDLKQKDLNRLGLFAYELQKYYTETLKMLDNWCEGFVIKLERKNIPVHIAFEQLKPITEKQYRSEQLGVRGFIDAIHEEEGHVTLLDYKTSKRNTLTDDYRLQLGIYALLYQLEHGVAPQQVGVNFLKHDEQVIDVDHELLDFAFQEIVQVHQCTKSREIGDYEKKPSGLCRWSTGQCDFYGTCKPFG